MQSISQTLMTLGGLLLIGLVTDALGRRTPLPRVSLLLMFGILIGPSALNLLPSAGLDLFPLITDMALLMVAFLLGEKMGLVYLRRYGKAVMIISLSVVIHTAAIVCLGLWLLGVPLELALLLAAVATATDPAATADAVREQGVQNRYSETLLGIVAIDDAWGLIAFSIFLVLAITLQMGDAELSIMVDAGRELFGAALLGLIMGLPMAYLSGRLRKGQPLFIEALGMVLLCGGVAIYFNISYLLATMVMGSVVANLARHHEYPFHAIANIEWPFMIIFFLLAGASLDIHQLQNMGLIGAGFITLRFFSRILGGWLGGMLAHSDPFTRRWIGVALMPQAGVAIGMGLLASERFPQYSEILLQTVISATIVFELSGPVLTRIALLRSRQQQ